MTSFEFEYVIFTEAFNNSLSILEFCQRILHNHSSKMLNGAWGSRDGTVVRALASHQCVPGSIPGPGVICGLSLLLVLFSAPRGFSPGTPVFPSPQKPTFPNSNSILECTDISERVLVNSLVLRG